MIERILQLEGWYNGMVEVMHDFEKELDANRDSLNAITKAKNATDSRLAAICDHLGIDFKMQPKKLVAIPKENKKGQEPSAKRNTHEHKFFHGRVQVEKHEDLYEFIVWNKDKGWERPIHHFTLDEPTFNDLKKVIALFDGD